MLFVPFFRGLARHLHVACLALIATTTAVLAQTTPSAADGYDPNVDGTVLAAVAQGDGKIIIVGQFANVSPNGGISIARNNIARLNQDGSLDLDFNPDVNGTIRAIALQSNAIIIGGDFTKAGGQDHNRLARIDLSGNVDQSFKAGVTTSAKLPTTPQVLALAVQADNAIIVGGTFGSAISTSGTTVVRNNLARFNSAGVLDLTYDPNPNSTVLSLALHVDGKIVVGGGFTKFQENGSSTATDRLRIARVNPSGTLDSEFNPKANNAVSTIAVQRDGKIVLGGFFTTLQPIGNDTPANLSHIARLNVNGTLDSEFYPVVGGNVTTIAIARDGGILVGGAFSQVWGRGESSTAAPFLARFGADGSVDQSFFAGLNGEVAAIVPQSDGKIVIAGYFTRAQPSGVATPLVRNHVARLSGTGSQDAAFQLDPGGRILAAVTQNDKKIVVAGSFTSIGGLSRKFMARLNTDGSVDTTYNPTLNGPVYSMAYSSSEDKVVIGGAFTTVGSDTRNHIARLNANGTVDSEFNPNIDGPVGTVVIQSDKKILVAGSFANVFPYTDTATTARANIARLTATGGVDTTFNPTTNAAVAGIAVQSDGKIIIVGSFNALQPGASGSVYPRSYIARLNADGSIDSGYDVAADAPINAIALQSDKAIIGGRFTRVLPSKATASVDRRFLARFNVDGSIDDTFDPNPNSMVIAIAVQPDSKILIGGIFTTLQPNKPTAETNWTQRKYAARLNADGTIDKTFNLDVNEQLGNRVDSFAITTNDDILVGGQFTSLRPNETGTRILRRGFARIKKDGTLDSAFDPGAGGSVSATIRAITIQTDNKIVVAGNFSDLGNAASKNIARFNPEGGPDSVFNNALSTEGGTGINALAVRANGVVLPTQLGGFAWLESNGNLRNTFTPDIRTQGRVNVAIVEPSGSLLLAGSFTDLTNQTKGNLVRLSATGKVDTSFTPSVNGPIYAMLRLTDGRIVIGGDFTTVNDVTRNRIARFNADGTLDTTFDPNANGAIFAMVLDDSGKIVIAGGFTGLTPNNASTSTSRNYIARIETVGTLDTGYNPNLNGTVNAMVREDSGKIVVGGSFTTVQPNSDTTATNRNRIARFDSSGNVDKNFAPDFNDTVVGIEYEQPTQSFVVVGAFTSVSNTTHKFIVRLANNGTPASDFVPTANSTITAVTRTASGSLLIGGFFTTVTSSGSSTEIARNHFARISSTGQLEADFNPDIAGFISRTYVASDGSLLVGGTFSSLQATGVLLVGGDFTTIGGIAQKNLAQLNGDGSISPSFQPNPDAPVQAVLPLPDGRFVVGGSFTKIANATRSSVARFKSDGSLDDAFLTTGVASATTLALQPNDGKILVGTTGGLIRLNTDGSRDVGFNAVVPFAPVVATAVQADGKILVAGPGSGVGSRLVRLNADGTADTSFTTVTPSGGDIQAIALQANGAVIVGGSFTALNGVSVSRLGRVSAAGAVDATFNPAPNNTVSALALQSDGRLMIGGTFTAVGSLQRFALARVSNTSGATQELGISADGKTITWIRRGTTGEISGVTFEQSSDAQSWTFIGNGTRVGTSSDWELKNVTTLPASTTFYIRARGIAPTSAGKSTGVYESIRLENLASPVPWVGTSVANVITNNTWDQSHYVWTIDAAGILRVVDAFSLAVVDASKLGGTPTTSASSAGLADLSTRGNVSANSPLIAGFSIVGDKARAVLIRAVGPGLSSFGVSDYLRTPQLRVYNASTNTVIAANNGWNNDATLSAVFARTGAFPLPSGSADAALVTTLFPGSYTVQVVDGGAGSQGGNALVEVYDAGDLADTSARLINLSSRGTVSPSGALIGGLVVSGNAPKAVLIRGVGPTLAKYGVTGTLADPIVTVYDRDGRVVVSNDNWQVSSQPTIPELDFGAAMSGAAATVGAFPLDSGSKDAALVITLAAGSYTVQVSGVNNTSGAAMIEVYEMP